MRTSLAPFLWRFRKAGFCNFLKLLRNANLPNSEERAHHNCTGKHLTAHAVHALFEEARENGDPIPNLSGKCLHDENLSIIGNLSRVRLDHANLEGANLARCNLEHASLREANLQNADLYNASLVDATLEKTNLQNACLTYVDFTRANLTGANLRGADLKGAIFQRTLMRVDSLGEYIKQETEYNFLDAQAIYLALKENFQSIGLYDAASWAYIRERISERHTFSPWQAIKYYGPKPASHNVSQQDNPQRRTFVSRIIQIIRQIKHLIQPLYFWLTHGYCWKWITSLAQEWIWGYGQQPARVIIVCLTFIPIFALIYMIDGGIQISHREPTFEELILYSLATFTTSTIPEISPISKSAQFLSSLEGILGVTTLALFTTALAQRMGGR